jgi:hypothetical protein
MKKRVKIIVPNFVFPDGREDILMAYDRQCGPCGVEPSYIENKGIFDCNGNYYSMWVDHRSNRKRKSTTYYLDGHEFNQPISRFCTMGCFVNPQDGYLWSIRPAASLESQNCTIAAYDSSLTFTMFPELVPHLAHIKWETDCLGRFYFKRSHPGQPTERVYLKDYVIKNLLVYVRNCSDGSGGQND